MEKLIKFNGKTMQSKEEKKISNMFDTISPTYDKVNKVLSLGIDRYWRKQIFKNFPKKEEIKLLDMATGTGDVLINACTTKSASTGVGIDIAAKMLEIASKKAKATSVDNVIQFEVGSALDIKYPDNHFDVATISFGIRNVENVDLALKEMHRVLKPNGRILVLEFSMPKSKLIKSGYLLYLRKILPSIGGLISKSKSSYSYLNQTIETFPKGKDFLKMLEKAGFKNALDLPLTFGIASLYRADKC